MGIFVKNDGQIQKMRHAAKIVAKAHETVAKYVKIGVTTKELDRIAEDCIRSANAVPSFLGYRDYPAATCISVNDQVIHGLPGLRRLKNGDIVSIDIGAFLDGFHGDAARTLGVGEIAPTHQQLIDATRQSFFEAIVYAKDGKHLNELSCAVEDYVTAFGFSVVREWCGHGIGAKLHEDPSIPHYRTNKRGPRLTRGMTLAIEPMVNEGKAKTKIHSDGFTVVTADGKYSAHYENTVLITDGEPEVMTL